MKDMISLRKFLLGAPKKITSHLYKKQSAVKGVVQGKEVLEKTLAWADNPKRVRQIIQELGPEKKKLLLQIYLSENRGLLESDLYSLSFEMNAQEISNTVLKFESELLLCCRKGDYYSFHGFANFFDLITSTLLAEFRFEKRPSLTWVSNSSHLISHLIFFIAQTQLGNVKSTQKGDFHRRSTTSLLEKLAHGQVLSRSCSETEFDLLMQFLIDETFILDYHNDLLVSPAGLQLLKKPLGDVHQKLFNWWHPKRLCKSEGILKSILQHFPQGVPIGQLCFWFRPFSPGARAARPMQSLTWDGLPSALKELWVMGGLDLALEKGKITHGKINPQVLSILRDPGYKPGPGAKEKTFSLPNFEILLPTQIDPWHRYCIECLAERKNDEAVTTYRFSKETVVSGLSAGISQDDFRECLQALKFERHTEHTLREWAATYQSTEFKACLILKVQNSETLEALQQIPRFLELTLETIPGYGFIIPGRNKSPVKEFLTQFGLTPGDPTLRINPKNALPLKQEYAKLFSSYFPPGELNYSLEPRNRHWLKRSGSKKMAEAPAKTSSQAEMLRTVDHAILAEKKLELSYMDKEAKRLLIRPLHLLRDHDPISIIGTEVKTGVRGEFTIPQITSLRIID